MSHLQSESIKMESEAMLSVSLSHDSGAALFINGKLMAAIGEERLNREKFTRKFPEKSIVEVLRLGGVSPRDVNKVIIPSRITPNWISLKLPEFHTAESSSVFSPLLPWVIREQVFFRKSGLIHLEGRMIASHIRKQLVDLSIRADIIMMDHHDSHAYSAYSTASFDKSMVISMDAMGDGLSCTTSLGDDGFLKKVDEMNGFHAPSFIYSMITELLGFTPGRHEGKITGLAALGDPTVLENEFRTIIDISDGVFIVRKIYGRNDPIFRKILTHTPENIAAALQFVFEDIIVKYIKLQLAKHCRTKLALAGGVFANVKLNQKIFADCGLEEIYIFPNMGDGGTPVGAGFAYYSSVPARLDTIYLGPAHSESEIVGAIRSAGLEFTQHSNIEAVIAALLAKGKVVGRFAGRMEYGPRALGNRSILAKADDRSINDWLNKRLKRTEFMPFAPSTLMEFADKYYVNTKGAEDAARYMTITFNCTAESSKMQPACVHVDNTARPQLVDSKDNPSYHKIIEEFYKLTGVASILNTSFNIHEEPIVSSPEDAVKSFNQCRLDALAMDNFLIIKKDLV